MKRSLLLLLPALIATQTLSSCKKEKDKDSGSSNKSIIGNWTNLNTQYRAYFKGNLYKDTSVNLPDGEQTLTFNSDSTFSAKRKENTWGGTFSTSADSLKMYIKRDKDISNDFTVYTLSGDALDVFYKWKGSTNADSAFEYILHFKRK
ncbi:MAG: DUF4923 family protein [Chitinophagaceae bacterium]|jgi:hypothetical protein